LTGLILAAAGSGARFESSVPKQFLHIGERPVYALALEATCGLCDEVVLVVPSDWLQQVRTEQAGMKLHRRVRVVSGGRSRQESVALGLQALSPEVQTVLVHDAARPFVSPALVDRVLGGLEQAPACVPVVPIAETVKEVEGSRILQTLDRNRLRLAQTPQAFRRTVLEKALNRAARECAEATDEAALVERIGEAVYAVDGDRQNIKITWNEDLQDAGAGDPSFHESE
jgi:2-C-methyl-D-erythritol 4-phosphate cytidylyltransferase